MTKKEFIEKWSPIRDLARSQFEIDLNSISDLPEQITNEQFEKELENRIYAINERPIAFYDQYYTENKQEPDFFDGITWLKKQLLKGGKG